MGAPTLQGETLESATGPGGSIPSLRNQEIGPRRIALLANDGVDLDALTKIREALVGEGASVRLLAPETVVFGAGRLLPLWADEDLELSDSVLFDEMIVCDGDPVKILPSEQVKIARFITETYRHLKPIIALGSAAGSC